MTEPEYKPATETNEPPTFQAAEEKRSLTAEKRHGKSREEKRSHKGMVVKFRVFPEEAGRLKERAAEASMPVSEFCRRAVSGKRIVSRYDYDVIRRLAELHGDQARLGNLLKLALGQNKEQDAGMDTIQVNSLVLRLMENQKKIGYLLDKTADS